MKSLLAALTSLKLSVVFITYFYLLSASAQWIDDDRELGLYCLSGVHELGFAESEKDKKNQSFIDSYSWPEDGRNDPVNDKKHILQKSDGRWIIHARSRPRPDSMYEMWVLDHQKDYRTRLSTDEIVVFENAEKAEAFCNGLLNLCKSSLPTSDKVIGILDNMSDGAGEFKLFIKLKVNDREEAASCSLGPLDDLEDYSDYLFKKR